MQERKLVRSWWLFLVPYVVLAACILRILMHPRYIYLSTCSVKCPLKKERIQRRAGSYRCWFVKKYCWLVCVREKYCFGWKFTTSHSQTNRLGPADQQKTINNVGPLRCVLHLQHIYRHDYWSRI